MDARHTIDRMFERRARRDPFARREQEAEAARRPVTSMPPYRE